MEFTVVVHQKAYLERERGEGRRCGELVIRNKSIKILNKYRGETSLQQENKFKQSIKLLPQRKMNTKSICIIRKGTENGQTKNTLEDRQPVRPEDYQKEITEVKRADRLRDWLTTRMTDGQSYGHTDRQVNRPADK